MKVLLPTIAVYRGERPVERTRADEMYSAEFINAFNAEFGLILTKQSMGGQS